MVAVLFNEIDKNIILFLLINIIFIDSLHVILPNMQNI